MIEVKYEKDQIWNWKFISKGKIWNWFNYGIRLSVYILYEKLNIYW